MLVRQQICKLRSKRKLREPSNQRRFSGTLFFFQRITHVFHIRPSIGFHLYTKVTNNIELIADLDTRRNLAPI